MSRPGFLTKARLRRLLMSDDVWSFGRKRHPAKFALNEDASVPQLEAEGQQNGQIALDSPARYPQQHQAPKQQQQQQQQQQLRDEGPRADEEQQTPGLQHDADIISQPTNDETKQSLLSHSVIGQHVMKSPPPKDETDQSRVTVLKSCDQLPVCELSTRPVASKRPDWQSVACLPLDRAKKGSLTSHPSDCKSRGGHHISENTQETPTITFVDLSSENTDLSDTDSDTTSLNVQNNQRSQSALMLNNNHEDGLNISLSDPEHHGETLPPPPSPLLPPLPPLGVSTVEEISLGRPGATAPIACPNTQTSPPETFMRRTVLVKMDSVDSGSVGSELQKQACDSSPSGADNLSSLSLSTESLGSSEDESHKHKMGYSDRCGILGRGYESYPGQRRGGDWEERLVLPDFEEGERVLDSLLSEILSPVDEVLSYGSLELPPSARGAAGSGSASLSLGLPPAPPAFEIITWTSEEDLPPPPTQELDQDQDQGPGEDPSIASEHIPSLPPDSPLPPPPTPSPLLPPPLTPPRSSVPAEGVDSFHCHCVEIGGDDDGDDEDDDDNGEDLSESIPLQDLLSENEDQSENTTSLPVDEGNDLSDSLASFAIGDRVLVCRSRPGVLRFKGPTAFASGTWAGVELDAPNGNHDGTFRGVRYFTCERNRGVLVRAEDLSHLSREPGSDLDTGLDEDPFSDEEPPHRSKLPQSEQMGNLFSGRTTEQDKGRTQNSSSTSSSGPRRICGDIKHRHSLQANDTFPQSRCSTFRKGISRTEGDLQVNSAESCLNNNRCESSPSRLASWLMDGALKDAYASRSVRRNVFREAHRPRSTDFKKMEDVFRPCLVDQWHSEHRPEAPSRVPVHPHDCEMVYQLGEAAVDMLFCSGRADANQCCETPTYLINDESRNRYRQVFFSLTSDIFHEVFSDVIATGPCLKRADATHVLSELQSRKLSIRDIKVVIKREIQKMLNLEKSEKQIQEMLQTLCKFWHTKRDRVDYILIQELQAEEEQWVDYSLDQQAVKTRLAEDIFRLLLDDTVTVLRGIRSSLHHTPRHANY